MSTTFNIKVNMSKLANTMLSISFDQRPNVEEELEEPLFKEEYLKTLDIFKSNNFDNLETMYDIEDYEEGNIEAVLDVTVVGLYTLYRVTDDEGDLEEEEVGEYDIFDMYEHRLVFEQIKSLFDPTPIPMLAANWDKVTGISLSPTGVEFDFFDIFDDYQLKHHS